MHRRWRAVAAALKRESPKDIIDWLSLALAFIIGYLIVTWISVALNASMAHARDNGQYSQVSPEIRQWWKNQRIPGGQFAGQSCCSEADGTFAEAETRGDKWFARFSVKSGGQEYPIDWMQVPDEAVMTVPNRYGAPIVWYGAQYNNGKIANVWIRCFMPGAGI